MGLPEYDADALKHVGVLAIYIYIYIILLVNICAFVGLDSEMLECQRSSNSVRTLRFSDLGCKFWYECQWGIILYEVILNGMTTGSSESSLYKKFVVFQF